MRYDLTEKRNSSIELLRIVSMLMIILHHFVYANMDSFLKENSFIQSFFLYFFFSLGKIFFLSFLHGFWQIKK